MVSLRSVLWQVKELREALGPLTGRAAIFCTDDCLRRYLRARNWNVHNAEKMLRDTLAWRNEYRPEEITWVRCREKMLKNSGERAFHSVCLRDSKFQSQMQSEVTHDSLLSRTRMYKVFRERVSRCYFRPLSCEETPCAFNDYSSIALSLMSMPDHACSNFSCQQEDIAVEAETGKVYRTTYLDRLGRPVIIMVVGKQVKCSVFL